MPTEESKAQVTGWPVHGVANIGRRHAAADAQQRRVDLIIAALYSKGMFLLTSTNALISIYY